MKTTFKTTSDTLAFGKHRDKTITEVLEENPQYVSWLFTSGAANFSKTCLKEIVAAGHEDIVEMINKEKDKKAQARKLKREKALKTEKFNELIKQGNWEEAEKYI